MKNLNEITEKVKKICASKSASISASIPIELKNKINYHCKNSRVKQDELLNVIISDFLTDYFKEIKVPEATKKEKITEDKKIEKVNEIKKTEVKNTTPNSDTFFRNKEVL